MYETVVLGAMFFKNIKIFLFIHNFPLHVLIILALNSVCIFFIINCWNGTNIL